MVIVDEKLAPPHRVIRTISNTILDSGLRFGPSCIFYVKREMK